MTRTVALCAVLLVALIAAAAALGANPPEGVLRPDAAGKGELKWTGTVGPGLASAPSQQGEHCFDAARRPDPASGCDVFRFTVDVPAGYYERHPGAATVAIEGFGSIRDIDLYVYRRNADGTRGEFVDGSAFAISPQESVGVDRPAGDFFAVVVPYLNEPDATYAGSVRLVTREIATPLDLNARLRPGFPNFRASRDRYTSHSEPTIAMDVRDPDHLMAASKMYENNEKYLFKVGTYESRDGGRTWEDQGMLPGYCQSVGQCDPADEARYRTTSDPTLAFDDEGNAYANVLDAPGGTFAFRGFNMTAHIKRPDQPWSDPITVHDNRTNALTEQLFLDDKNWIAVDNVTDVNGGPNRPGDGKTGTIYICWSFDGTEVPAVGLPLPLQQIVVMRSRDGGRTWGGLAPGDNLPLPVSQKTLISGIGCHISIGPRGEVYITWYDNQTNLLWMARSTNRGATFTPQYPIALIDGVNEPFEGESFRNLSIPSTSVDPRTGRLYVVAASRQASGSPVLANAPALGEKLKRGELTPEDVVDSLNSPKANDISRQRYAAGGDGEGPGSGSDVVMFYSDDGGNGWHGPVRVNQDARNADGDQFQPWIAVTHKGQVNVSYFDRRNDPQNYLIDTYLSRSNDGGRTWTDTRASERPWDPAVNSPTSVSGKFIGDYQGLVANDDVAIPFWNDTQLNALPRDDPEHSPYQEVFAARVPNGPASWISGARATRTVKLRARSRTLTLRGVASDPGGGTLAGVEIAVTRQAGRRCLAYSPRRKRLVRRACDRPLWFAARGTADWSVRLVRKGLRPGGRYTIRSRARNRGGAVESETAAGRNTAQLRVKRR